MLRALARIPRSLVQRFHRDTGGAAALEFALLLPLLLFLYLTVVELCQAFMAQRRASHATSQIADIVAQGDTVNKQTLNGYFDVANMIIAPFPASPLKIKVTSVGKDSQNRTVVLWSHARGMSPDTKNSVVPVSQIPAGLLINSTDTYIVSETEYGYDSPYDITVPGFTDILSGITTFRRKFYLRPREIAQITCTDC